MDRIRVSLRRAAHSEEEPGVVYGGLKMDLTQRRVTVGAARSRLTPTEYDLLKELVQNAGKVITHKQQLQTVWGNLRNEDTHYIRVYIGQLRRKIEEDPTQPRYIISEPGAGYWLMGK